MKTTVKHFFQIGFSLLLLGFSSVSAAEEIKQTHNGLTLNANLVMADGADFSGKMVLLTHGTLTHAGRSTYANLQDLLAQRGVSSLAPNLSLGVNDRHGEYDCKTPHRHRHQDAVDEIGLWLDWLKTQGATQVTLMGHSRGGNQTARFSVEHPESVIKSVVLIAPQTWDYNTLVTEYEAKSGQSIDPIFKKAQDLVKAGKGDTLINNIDFMYCKDTSASANAVVSYYQNDPKMDTPSLLKKATLPTLVVIGSADTVVADLEEKMQDVNNEQVQTTVIEDADHFFRDFFAEDVADQSVEFIESQS